MTPTLAQVTKELLQTYSRHPRKKLGQHFLIDPLVLQRIIKAAELSSDDLVIEIGSGLGVVTSELAKIAHHVIAVEIDKELLRISQEVLKPFSNISYLAKDVLKIDLANIQLQTSNIQTNIKSQNPTSNFKIIGNLPYYITAPIVEKILTAEQKPKLAVLMVQKEVAERMAAEPGTKKYGSFSIFTQYHAEVELNSFVSKSSFLPWPEVSSAIVVLKPYHSPKYEVKNKKRFFEIVHAAFQQRRKKLRNSLGKFKLEGTGIDLNRRPERLGIEEFALLASPLTSPNRLIQYS